MHGFRSFDERDLLGFVDGTENPEGGDAEEAVVIAADDDPTYAGGSYLVIQKYTHDLVAWGALSIEEQEAAIGRTKLDDVEFADEDKAPDSHLTLNVIEGPDGEERQIMRFNMPFGRVGSAEFGTFYVAYAKTAELDRGDARQHVPRPRAKRPTTASSTSPPPSPAASTSSPAPTSSTTHPRRAPPKPPRPAEPEADAPAAPPADGSLGIGGLK